MFKLAPLVAAISLSLFSSAAVAQECGASNTGCTNTINLDGIGNAADYIALVAPGSIAVVYGNFPIGSYNEDFSVNNPNPSTMQASSVPLPTLLSWPSGGMGGPATFGLDFLYDPQPTTVTGASASWSQVYAPMFYASGTQLNIQVPWELSGWENTGVDAFTEWFSGCDDCRSPTSSVGQRLLPLASTAPGIFTMNAQGTGQGAVLDTSYRLVDASNPAIPGTTYIQIYCTGLGPVTNQPATGAPGPSNPLAETTATPTVVIGSETQVVIAPVVFSGLAPGFVGLYQINARVPAGAPTGTAVGLAISIGDQRSNSVTIAVGN
jgi:uncharacterized protein (TIGR03437 family)